MSEWVEAYRDTHKIIEKRQTDQLNDEGYPVWEERTTYTDPLSDEALLAAYMDQQRASA